MTTFGLGEHVTALELSKHIHEGALLPLIQALSQQMEMFGDVNMEAANDGMGHIGTTEFSQPTGTFRAFNEGIATEVPASAEFREPLVMLDGRFKADRAFQRLLPVKPLVSNTRGFLCFDAGKPTRLAFIRVRENKIRS